MTSQYSLDYEALLLRALNAKISTNERTGEAIYTIRGGVHLEVDLSSGLLPVPRFRKIHLRSAAAEVAWFLMGTQDSTWMRGYAPFWDKFVEADGTTIASAYGYRWLKHFGRDQIKDAVASLTRNPSDRRCYISAWDPSADGLGRPGKNVPCPVGFTLSVVEGELHSSMLIRSSDLFVGLPYDVLGHAMLLFAIADTLQVNPGVATFTMAHPHLYAKHRGMAEEGFQRLADGNWSQPKVHVPAVGYIDLVDIMEAPEEYVDQWAQIGLDQVRVEFNPRPEIIP